MIALFAVLILVTGAGALVLSQRQAEQFAETTAQSEAEMEAFTLLQHEILAAAEPMTAVLYEFDRDAALEEQWDAWASGHQSVAELFTQLRAAVAAQGSDSRQNVATEDIAHAERLWTEVGVGVSAAKKAWGSGEALADLAAGSDPFEATVWEPYNSTQREVAQLSVAGVQNMRAESDDASRNQDTARTVVGAALLLSLLVGILGVRRMSTRVINPLVSLRSTVAHLQGGDLSGPVEVPRAAGSEVVDLAQAIADMAVALNRTQAHLRDQAYTDGLTGLANRRAFNEELERDCANGCDSRTSVVLVDVDDFKDVNDSLGHAVGDKLLVAVARRLQAQARSTDTVGRIGGDEFAMIVRGEDSLGAALVVAERLMAAFEDDLWIDGARIEISCSAGIADGHGAASADEVVRHADAAMYVAKSRGKSCFEAFDGTLHATMLSRSSLKDELQDAPGNDELELHYQPVIDLDTDDILGFEALVRWRHPERGLLMPAAFIDIAEESGAIVGIGDWVIDRACRDLSRMSRIRTGTDPLWIAVNVSARQLANGEVVHTVRRALDRHGIDPKLLTLELTEAQLLNDPVHVSAVLEELRSDGVRIAIDDFGTGFSSLQYLHDLPVDILKIDRSFVRDRASTNDVGGTVLLEAIAAMGKGLGLALIAEGIEEQSELERVKQLGSMAGQGYFFAHPMTIEDASVLFDSSVVCV